MGSAPAWMRRLGVYTWALWARGGGQAMRKRDAILRQGRARGAGGGAVNTAVTCPFMTRMKGCEAWKPLAGTTWRGGSKGAGDGTEYLWKLNVSGSDAQRDQGPSQSPVWLKIRVKEPPQEKGRLLPDSRSPPAYLRGQRGAVHLAGLCWRDEPRLGGTNTPPDSELF